MLALKATLRLSSKIWDHEARRSIVNGGLTACAKFLESELKANIDRSTPAGKLYRVGRITEKRTKTNKYLKRARGTATRAYVRAVYHRASAINQPPARYTSRLYSSLKARRNPGKLEIIASANAPGAATLDDPSALSRPFFKGPVVTYYNNVFPIQMNRVITALLEGRSIIRIDI